MEEIQQSINLEPLNSFFTQEISPKELSELLDEFLFEYIGILVRLSYSNDEEGIHLQTHQFLYYLRTLRDILPKCQEVV